MRLLKSVASLSAISVVLLSAAPAVAETVNCTPITSVPTVITLPGVYCFTKSFATAVATGHLIDIQANNVVLDMNGHRLGGLAVGLGTNANGIHALDRQNITIKNGTVRGFLRGIWIESTSASLGHLIEDVRADQNTAFGISVQGVGIIIRNNQVVSTGGTTSLGTNVTTVGIAVVGDGVRVLNNDVHTVTGVGTFAGMGIRLSGSNGALSVGNRITSADFGIAYFTSTGKHRDNLTFGVATPFSGGTDAGNNN